MKNESERLPFDYEEEIDTATNHITLTAQEAIELQVCSCIKVKGMFMYKRARFDSVLQVNGSLKQGEIIAETNSAVFILSPKQSQSTCAPKSLIIPEHILVEEKIKDNYYKGILSRVPVR